MLESYIGATGGTLAALILYMWTVIRVGQARSQFGVQAPSVSGDAGFDRVFRVQQNTLEQLALFLPLLWLLALSWGDRVAAVASALWLVGRVMYARAYIQDAARRGPGFAVAGLTVLAMLIAVLARWLMYIL